MSEFGQCRPMGTRQQLDFLRQSVPTRRYLEAPSFWNFKLCRKNLRMRGRGQKTAYVWLPVLETGLGNRVEKQGAPSSVAWNSIFPLQHPASLYPYLCSTSEVLLAGFFGDSTCSLCLGMVKRSSDSVPGGRAVTRGSISAVYRLSINLGFSHLSHPSTSLRLSIPRACPLGHVGLFSLLFFLFCSVLFYSPFKKPLLATKHGFLRGPLVSPACTLDICLFFSFIISWNHLSSPASFPIFFVFVALCLLKILLLSC